MVPKALWEYGVTDPNDPSYVFTDISWSINPDQWETARAQLASILSGSPPPPSPCDVNGDGMTNVLDVQLEVNMSLGVLLPCTNPSGTCTVTSVQRVTNAALGGACVSP
jgi:hypothetical protein